MQIKSLVIARLELPRLGSLVTRLISLRFPTRKQSLENNDAFQMREDTQQHAGMLSSTGIGTDFLEELLRRYGDGLDERHHSPQQDPPIDGSVTILDADEDGLDKRHHSPQPDPPTDDDTSFHDLDEDLNSVCGEDALMVIATARQGAESNHEDLVGGGVESSRTKVMSWLELSAD